MTKYRIPDELPWSIEIDDDLYALAEYATVRQWRDAIEFTETRDQADRRAVNRMVELAEKLDLPDDVLLVSWLEEFAIDNVITDKAFRVASCMIGPPATDFLGNLLSKQPRRRRTIFELGRHSGFTRKALHLARVALKVRVLTGADGKIHWALPNGVNLVRLVVDNENPQSLPRQK